MTKIYMTEKEINSDKCSLPAINSGEFKRLQNTAINYTKVRNRIIGLEVTIHKNVLTQKEEDVMIAKLQVLAELQDFITELEKEDG